MHIRSSDFQLVRLASLAKPLFLTLGDIESRWLHRRLSEIELVKPVFITGLARSGTTMLLELLAKLPAVATHRYRDFPFLMTPYAWNRFVSRYSTPQPPSERPHQDRIRITAESPEAFEEPIWHAFFPWMHAPDALHRLSADHRHEEFERFFKDHLRKVLLVRQGSRYLSKGNYNLTRLEYLGMIFPDARFVVPIRHPLTHVHSLVRQNRLFHEYAERDRRVPEYLAAAGHFEFGPQRVPIRMSAAGGERIRRLWSEGSDELGYAVQWAEVYRWIHDLRGRSDDLARRILIVPYERFCSAPLTELQALLQHIELPATIDTNVIAHIAQSGQPVLDIPNDVRESIWNETAEVAGLYGYQTLASFG